MDDALVFAGTSFIGRHLFDRLGTAGISFHATARASPGMMPCDLTQAEQTEAVLKNTRPRWIFQCAGATSTSNPAELRRLHVDATENLLRAVKSHVPEAVVVLFGSAAEYGPVAPEQLPIREETPARPDSPYGQSKLGQLQLAERLAQEHGLRVHVVRPFNVVGPGLGTHFFIAALIERLRRTQPGDVPIVNGRATRDWIDVRDVADAVVRLALNAPPQPGRVGLYNIATGVETSVLSVAEYLCELAGDFHAVDEGVETSRTGIDRSCGDAGRLRTVAGWRPKYTWQESARAMWDAS